jgi:RNA polymerase sigma factor (sigma-70 family)
MAEREYLTEQFEAERPHLRAVAYRMLGTTGEADDALQEAWLKLDRSGADGVENMRAWLTTVVARVCLDMLRTRKSRREESLGPHIPEPIVEPEAGGNPEYEALLADGVGLALLVVLETLGPQERLAFVLHDMFGVSFDEIAPIVDRTPAAARKMASRARARVRGATPAPDPDLTRQREVVDAFLAASRAGDFEALLEVLDPDVVFRLDAAAQVRGPRFVRGAEDVAARIMENGNRFAAQARPALVNGTAGVILAPNDKPFSVAGFLISGGKIVEMDILADPVRLKDIDVSEIPLPSE